MRYELYYWPIQGRGEFARLVLEDAGAEYDDIGRQPGGIEKMMQLLSRGAPDLLPFAPPFLRAGELWLSQTSMIAAYLGEQHGLAPAGEAARHHARSIMLTIMDLLDEVHLTHHPVAVDKVYEEQKPAAAQRAQSFRELRLPKFLRYLERTLERSSHGVFVGSQISYVDLAAFQMVEGLSYAFPRAFGRLREQTTRLHGLHDRIAERPGLAAYLASPRRVPFDRHGIFRHYPELDP